jgi:hypothetical protein
MRPSALTCGLVAFALWMVPGLSAPASVTPWPEIPTLEKARVEWVAKDVWINGVPTRVQQFESTQSPERVMAYYRSLWRSGEAGPPRENNHAEWRMIATIHGPFQMVVQVKPSGASGSKGIMSCVNLKEVKARYLPPEWPRNAPLKVLQVMESVDGPKRSFHIMATSDRGLALVRDHLRSVWGQRGWRLQNEVDEAASYLATYAYSGKTMEVALSPGRERSQVNVVVHFVQFLKS